MRTVKLLKRLLIHSTILITVLLIKSTKPYAYVYIMSSEYYMGRWSYTMGVSEPAVNVI